MKMMAAVLGLLASSLLVGRTSRIEVAAPKEPITINMNVKVEHEIHTKADKDIESLLKSRSDLLRGHDEKTVCSGTGRPEFTQQ